MNSIINNFIKEQTAFTFCTSVNNIPHCASCFYAYDEAHHRFIFKSKKETKHISNALVNSNVAGTIIPDISRVAMVKGIQFTGFFSIPTNDLLKKIQNIYYLKYPFALTMKGELWVVELLQIKMTDNTLGFGKKYTWKKENSALNNL